ncbi:hypothetical protein Skr01_28080 [Sphaerisporangium krabiense]|nr:hypothetical protein Skr01_28080 [Sphaerisporangium krabiense]
MVFWRERSVRTRFTAVASTVMALACAGMCALVLVGTRYAVHQYRLHQITLVHLRVAQLINRGHLPPVIADRAADGIQVVDGKGRIAAASPNLIGKPLMARFVPPDHLAHLARAVCSAPGFPGECVHVVVARHANDGQGDWLVYAAGRTPPWYVDPGLFALLAAGSMALVAVTGFGTHRMVSRTLVPVDRVRAELAEITASDLSRRVPLPPHRDEIRCLAETVNQTLDRLQEAAERQRRFAFDASHDLRSPITAMRAQVEDALAHPEDAEWLKIAEAVMASLDRVQAIVTDLLDIARLDAGGRVSRDHIDLAELVRTETGRRARGKGLVLDLQPGVVVGGDRLQLARLLTNLLDNGERHAASTITVALRREGEDAVMEVVDDGEGIRPEHRELVFQRFTRLAASRERDKHGTGLGLAIAREIAERHGGTLTIEDSPKGARFVLRVHTLHLMKNRTLT